jgi:hypothetical protein
MTLSSAEWARLIVLEQEMDHVRLTIDKEEDWYGEALPHLEAMYQVENYLKDRIANLKTRSET